MEMSSYLNLAGTSGESGAADVVGQPNGYGGVGLVCGGCLLNLATFDMFNCLLK